jgi:Excalibur calcium-binding domain
MMQRRNVVSLAAVAILVVLGGVQAEGAQASSPHFSTCTKMHRSYPHGVGRTGAVDHVKGKSKPVTDFYRSTSIYNANKKLDRDKDGVACEAH